MEVKLLVLNFWLLFNNGWLHSNIWLRFLNILNLKWTIIVNSILNTEKCLHVLGVQWRVILDTIYKNLKLKFRYIGYFIFVKGKSNWKKILVSLLRQHLNLSYFQSLVHQTFLVKLIVRAEHWKVDGCEEIVCNLFSLTSVISVWRS